MSNALSGIKRNGLNATQLKAFAAAAMLIDHLTYTFLECTVDPGTGLITAYSSSAMYALDFIGRAIGRQAFPIFAFFIIEGFYHTRSCVRYFGCLLAFAVLSQAPFHLMCYTGPVGVTRTAGLNVYATLALGLAAVWVLDALVLRHILLWRQTDVSGSAGRLAVSAQTLLRGGAAAAAITGICLLAAYLNTDYSYIGIIAIVLFCIFRGKKIGVFIVWIWLMWGSRMEFFALPGLLLLTLYNGERGRCIRAGKYAFYLFYPLHMAALWVLRIAVFGS